MLSANSSGRKERKEWKGCEEGMKKYTVKIIEKYSRTIEIEADSETNAKQKAQAMWKNGEILLGDRDFEGTEYKVDSKKPEYPCINCCSASEIAFCCGCEKERQWREKNKDK